MLGARELGILDDDEERKESQHVTFRCPPDLYARLNRVVAETGKKRSRVIVRLLTYSLDALDKESEAASPRRTKK